MDFDDRKLFEHLDNIYMELCKYYIEDIYDVVINDNVSNFENTFNKYVNKESKIQYNNFLYSNKLEDDKHKKYGKITTINNKKSIDLSVAESIKIFGISFISWPDTVKFIGRWYEENIHTYQGGPPTDLSKCIYDFNFGFIKTIRDDCSGFVTCCLLVYILINDILKDINSFENNGELKTTLEKIVEWSPSSAIWDTIQNKTSDSENFKKLMEFIGFEEIKYDFSIIQPFDIIAGNDVINNGKFHHVEIYAGKKNNKHFSWAWGSVHDKDHGGMPAKFVKPEDNQNAYKTIWRLKGLTKITDNTILELP